MMERYAKSMISPNAIIVEFMHIPPKSAPRIKVSMFKPGTPVVVQALVFASEGYGTVEECYNVLAPSQGVTAPFSDGDRDVVEKLSRGIPMEQIIADLEQAANVAVADA